MKEQKRVPELRFAEFSGEWNYEQLENHIDLLSGYAFKGDDISEDKTGTPLLRGINITEGHIRHSEDIDRYYTNEIEKLKKYFLKENDLVLGMDGSKVGKNVALINVADEGSLLIQRVARIRAKKTSDIRFIYLNIFSSRFHRYVDVVNTSSGIPHISAKQIKEFKIGFPSLTEQQKIASFLSSVDKKTQQLQQKKHLLEQYKKGVMQQIFSQELSFTREDGNAYPDWEEKRLNKVSNINPKAKKIPNSFYYIDLESVNKGILTRKQRVELKNAPSRAQRLLKKGDLLFQTVRPYQKNNLHFNISDDDFVASTGYAQIRANESASYLFHFLHTNGFVNRVLSRCTGTSYPTINSSDLGKILIKIPCPDEQTQIANFLSAIDKKIAVVQTQLAQTQRFKKGLLQQLFV
ncbi:MAG TPA: restriction endonuclease subunit S [Muricauda sp.]|nr:restriction endonuclease subunit S [uncultured Allomuricauda sp.]MBC73971.1 hypothetical protein [Allomuricauda sp.]HBU78468.1 restriction endonuclease subunit S [Allomuricauda sp.]|tara:strand:- start:1379 stop:2599 length:1221 start_codon:yes stop_codon:yes gene_type:complete